MSSVGMYAHPWNMGTGHFKKYRFRQLNELFLEAMVLTALQARAAWYVKRFGQCRSDWYVFAAGKGHPNGSYAAGDYVKDRMDEGAG